MRTLKLMLYVFMLQSLCYSFLSIYTLKAQSSTDCEADAGIVSWSGSGSPCSGEGDIGIYGSDFNQNGTYKQMYLLVNSHGTIIDIVTIDTSITTTNIPAFPTPALGGSYDIYALNYDQESDFIIPNIGLTMTTVQNQSGCFDLEISIFEVVVYNQIQITPSPFCIPAEPDVFYVEFRISGGAFNPLYVINGQNTFGHAYESDNSYLTTRGPFPLGSNYSLTVEDISSGCYRQQTFEGPTDCTVTSDGCAADAGIISLPEHMDSWLAVCSSLEQGIPLINTGFNQDPHFKQVYLLTGVQDQIIAIADSLIGNHSFNVNDLNYARFIRALNYDTRTIPDISGFLYRRVTILNSTFDDYCFHLNKTEILIGLLKPIEIESHPFCDPAQPDVFFDHIKITGGWADRMNSGGYEVNWPPITVPWYPDSSFASAVIGPIPLDTPTYTIEVLDDGNGCSVSQTFTTPDLDCVPLVNILPGDCNDDGVSNVYDLFPIAWAYEAMGPLRPNTTQDWTEQETPAWTQNFDQPSFMDVNYAHADANGDGIINDLDMEVIRQNYQSEILEIPAGTPDEVPINLRVEVSDTLIPGYEHSFKVFLDTEAADLNQIYGIAFSASFTIATEVPDSIQIRLEQPFISYSQSWLGTVNNDMITIDTCLKDIGRWDIAMARTDQTGRIGQGEICAFNCIMEVGPLKNSLPINLTLSNIYIMSDSATYQVADMTMPLTELVLSYENQSSTLPTYNLAAQIAPNPAQDWVHIQVQQHSPRAIQLSIYDVLGNQIKQHTIPPTPSSIQLPISDLKSGIYLVELNNGVQKVIKKLFIVD